MQRRDVYESRGPFRNRARVERAAPGETFDAKLATPFAVLGIRTAGERVTRIEYLPRFVATLSPKTKTAAEVCRQIEQYLDDPDFEFTVPFDYRGTPFQDRVWRAIHAIPRGRTLTYLDIARQVKSAPRAVGGACGANLLPLVIPCHRVVASGGIGGFMHASGGEPIQIKQWLLKHENAG
jgi:methylated-DNA-[protein]-cysteine S-methyltransferase